MAATSCWRQRPVSPTSDAADLETVYTTMAGACDYSKTPLSVSQKDFMNAGSATVTTSAGGPTTIATATTGSLTTHDHRLQRAILSRSRAHPRRSRRAHRARPEAPMGAYRARPRWHYRGLVRRCGGNRGRHCVLRATASPVKEARAEGREPSHAAVAELWAAGQHGLRATPAQAAWVMGHCHPAAVRTSGSTAAPTRNGRSRRRRQRYRIRHTRSSSGMPANITQTGVRRRRRRHCLTHPNSQSRPPGDMAWRSLRAASRGQHQSLHPPGAVELPTPDFSQPVEMPASPAPQHVGSYSPYQHHHQPPAQAWTPTYREQ